MLPYLRLGLAALMLGMPVAALAQAGDSHSVGFGQRADIKAPVEVVAERLSVDQKTGQAVYSGDVVIGQGDMRLAADHVTVIYSTQGAQRIDALKAVGHVTLVNGPDAAEADQADYRIAEGVIVMTGDVIVTQGGNVLAGERVQVDLATGRADVSGRVRSVFRPDAR